ncbi:dynein heavy chain and region D6 of dynein motor-domain-containing protein [Pelagophyceae sp. CCMP2097]|nr:dynein heavy chain and region D6 of dynein motor-domain-containing protein [Pelagophyceae sp. CCMP2097]
MAERRRRPGGAGASAASALRKSRSQTAAKAVVSASASAVFRETASAAFIDAYSARGDDGTTGFRDARPKQVANTAEASKRRRTDLAAQRRIAAADAEAQAAAAEAAADAAAEKGRVAPASHGFLAAAVSKWRGSVEQFQVSAEQRLEDEAALGRVRALPLGEAMTEIMAAWASSRVGTAVFSQRPVLPLALFDDASHIELARKEQAKAFLSTSSAAGCALRSERIDADAAQAVLHWAECAVDYDAGGDFVIRWAEDGDSAQSVRAPALAVIYSGQCIFAASRRLQMALLRRAACEARLRRLHTLDSTSYCSTLVPSLWLELFPLLQAQLLPRIKPTAAATWRAYAPDWDAVELKLAGALFAEVEGDYARAMKALAFDSCAEAARQGRAPEWDARLVDDGTAVDLDELETAAKALVLRRGATIDDLCPERQAPSKARVFESAVVEARRSVARGLVRAMVLRLQGCAMERPSEAALRRHAEAAEGFDANGKKEPPRPLSADGGNVLASPAALQAFQCVLDLSGAVAARRLIRVDVLKESPQLFTAAVLGTLEEALVLVREWPVDVSAAITEALAGAGAAWDLTPEVLQKPPLRLLELVRHSMRTTLTDLLRQSCDSYLDVLEARSSDSRMSFRRKPMQSLDSEPSFGASDAGDDDDDDSSCAPSWTSALLGAVPKISRAWFRLELSANALLALQVDSLDMFGDAPSCEGMLGSETTLAVVEALKAPVRAAFTAAAGISDPASLCVRALRRKAPRPLLEGFRDSGALAADVFQPGADVPQWVRQRSKRITAAAGTVVKPVHDYVRSFVSRFARPILQALAATPEAAEARHYLFGSLCEKEEEEEESDENDSVDSAESVRPPLSLLEGASETLADIIAELDWDGAPPRPSDVWALDTELTQDLARLRTLTALDREVRCVCGLVEVSCDALRDVVSEKLVEKRNAVVRMHSRRAAGLAKWLDAQYRLLQRRLEEPGADPQATVLLEALLPLLPQLLEPLKALASKADALAIVCAKHGCALAEADAVLVLRCKGWWPGVVEQQAERARQEAERSRESHELDLDARRDDYELRLAAAANLTLFAAKFPERRSTFQDALEALAGTWDNVSQVAARFQLLKTELHLLRDAERDLKKPMTDQIGLMDLERALAPHLDAATAAKACLAVSDAIAQHALGVHDSDSDRAEDVSNCANAASRAVSVFERRFNAREDGDEAEDAFLRDAVKACKGTGWANDAASWRRKSQELDDRQRWWVKRTVTAEILAAAARFGDVWDVVQKLEVACFAHRLVPLPADVEDGVEGVATVENPAQALFASLLGCDPAYDLSWLLRSEAVKKEARLNAMLLMPQLGVELTFGMLVSDIDPQKLTSATASITRLQGHLVHSLRAFLVARQEEEVWSMRLVKMENQKVSREPAQGLASRPVPKRPFRDVVAGPVVANLDELGGAFDDSSIRLERSRKGMQGLDDDDDDAHGSLAADAISRLESTAQLLRRAEAILEAWARVQRKWAALARLFAPGGDALARQLPAETRTYAAVTQLLARVTSAARGRDGASPAHVTSLTDRVGPLEPLLLAAFADLDAVTRGLTDFAIAKRMDFARLYFIPEHELLDLLLSSENTERRVEAFVRRCFSGVDKLRCAGCEGSKCWPAEQLPAYCVVGLVGAAPLRNASTYLGSALDKRSFKDAAKRGPPECDELSLRRADYVEVVVSRPEQWLAALEKAMRNAMLDAVFGAVVALADRDTDAAASTQLRHVHVRDENRGLHPFILWACSKPGCAVLLASRIAFTMDFENLLHSKGGAAPADVARRQGRRVHCIADALQRPVVKESAPAPPPVAAPAPSKKRSKVPTPAPTPVEEPVDPVQHRALLESLAVLELHGRDVADRLAGLRVTTASEFAWASQLRFYHAGDAIMCEASVTRRACGDEFRGSTAAGARVVVTPATERCFLALLSVMQRGDGGALFGAAGAGKTSLAVELATALACPLASLDASAPHLTSQRISDVCRGALESGVWLLLTGVSAAQPAIMSAIGHHLGEVQSAQRAAGFGISALGPKAGAPLEPPATRREKYLRMVPDNEDVLRDLAPKMMDTAGRMTIVAPKFKPEARDAHRAAAVMLVLDSERGSISTSRRLPANLASRVRPVHVETPHLAVVLELLLVVKGFTIQGARDGARRVACAVKFLSESVDSKTRWETLCATDDEYGPSAKAALQGWHRWQSGVHVATQRPLRIASAVADHAAAARSAYGEDDLAHGDGVLCYDAFLRVVAHLLVDPRRAAVGALQAHAKTAKGSRESLGNPSAHRPPQGSTNEDPQAAEPDGGAQAAAQLASIVVADDARASGEAAAPRSRRRSRPSMAPPGPAPVLSRRVAMAAPPPSRRAAMAAPPPQSAAREAEAEAEPDVVEGVAESLLAEIVEFAFGIEWTARSATSIVSPAACVPTEERAFTRPGRTLLIDDYAGCFQNKIDVKRQLRRAHARLAGAGILPLDGAVRALCDISDALHCRGAVAVVGTAGTGKSTILNVAADKTRRIYASTLNTAELFGSVCGGVWRGGVAEVLFAAPRCDIAPKRSGLNKVPYLVVFDGVLEPCWADAVAAALDAKASVSGVDQLSASMHCSDRRFEAMPHVAFESDSLNDASPALVSRVSVTYLDDNETLAGATDAALQKWLRQRLPEDNFDAKVLASNLAAALDLHWLCALRLAKKFGASHPEHALSALTSILDGLLLLPLSPRPDVPRPSKFALQRASECAEAAVVWACAWACSSQLRSATQRLRFVASFRACAQSARGNLIVPSLNALWSNSAGTGALSLLDVSLDIANKRWVPWLETVAPTRKRPAAEWATPPRMDEILLVTPSAVAGARLARLAVAARRHALLFGCGRGGDAAAAAVAAGLGLLSCVQGPATQFDCGKVFGGDAFGGAAAFAQAQIIDANFDVAQIALPGTSGAAQLRDALERRLQRLRFQVYGGAERRSVVVRIDDVSCLSPRARDGTKACELLRQVVDDCSWHATETSAANLDDDAALLGRTLRVEGLTFMLTANSNVLFDRHMSGVDAWVESQASLPTRVLRHFSVFKVEDASEPVLATAFGGVLRDHVGAGAGLKAVGALARATVRLVAAACAAQRSACVPTAGANANHVYWHATTRLGLQFGRTDVLRILHGFLFSTAEPLATDASELLRLWAHEARRALGDRLPPEDDDSTRRGAAFGRGELEELLERCTTEASAGGPVGGAPFLQLVPPDAELHYNDLVSPKPVKRRMSGLFAAFDGLSPADEDDADAASIKTVVAHNSDEASRASAAESSRAEAAVAPDADEASQASSEAEAPAGEAEASDQVLEKRRRAAFALLRQRRPYLRVDPMQERNTVAEAAAVLADAAATRQAPVALFDVAIADVLRVARALRRGGHTVLLGSGACGRRTLARLACALVGAKPTFASDLIVGGGVGTVGGRENAQSRKHGTVNASAFVRALAKFANDVCDSEDPADGDASGDFAAGGAAAGEGPVDEATAPSEAPSGAPSRAKRPCGDERFAWRAAASALDKREVFVLVVSDHDVSGAGAEGWRALAALMRCGEADFPGSQSAERSEVRLQEVNARSKKLRQRLRIIVCFTTDAAAGRAGLAAAAATEPQLFESAGAVLHLAGWDEAAFNDVAQAAFNDWGSGSEDVSETGALRRGASLDMAVGNGGLGAASAKAAFLMHRAVTRAHAALARRGGAQWAAPPGAYVAFVREAALARARQLQALFLQLNRLRFAVETCCGAQAAAAELRANDVADGDDAQKQLERVADAKARYAVVESESDELQDRLKALTTDADYDELQKVKVDFQERADELERLTGFLDKALNSKKEARTEAAGERRAAGAQRSAVAVKLAAAVRGDALRWRAAEVDLVSKRRRLARDCLLAAAAATYAAALPREERIALHRQWLGILDDVADEFADGAGELTEPVAENDMDSSTRAVQRLAAAAAGSDEALTAHLDALALDLLSPLPLATVEWRLAGLRGDGDGAGVTAAALLLARRWPLLIDPERVARQFLSRCAQAVAVRQKTDASFVVSTTRLGHPDLVGKLTNAVLQGKWLLVEGVGEALDGDDGWALPPELAHVVQAGRALSERPVDGETSDDDAWLRAVLRADQRDGGGEGLAPEDIAEARVHPNFNLILISDAGDEALRSMPSRLQGLLGVVDVSCRASTGDFLNASPAGAALCEAHLLWDVFVPKELAATSERAAALCVRRAVVQRELRIMENSIIALLVRYTATSSEENRLGSSDSEIATRALREELLEAIDAVDAPADDAPASSGTAASGHEDAVSEKAAAAAEKAAAQKAAAQTHKKTLQLALECDRGLGISADLFDEADRIEKTIASADLLERKREELAILDRAASECQEAVKPVRFVAQHAARLFCALAALESARARGCYYVSLAAYTRRLRRSLDAFHCPQRLKDGLSSRQVGIWTKAMAVLIRRAAFETARRALFVKDHLVLALLLAATVFRAQKQMGDDDVLGANGWDEDEWRYVVSGETPTSAEDVDEVDSGWVGLGQRDIAETAQGRRSEAQRQRQSRVYTSFDASGGEAAAATEVGWWVQKRDLRVRALDAATLPALEGLGASLELADDLLKWNEVIEARLPHTMPFPAPMDALTPLQRLCVVRALRFDKLKPALEAFVEQDFFGGDFSLATRTAFENDLSSAAADAEPFGTETVGSEKMADDVPAPLLLTLAADADDPADALRTLATEQQISTLCVIGARGVDDDAVVSLVTNAALNGDWVIIQQCELLSPAILRRLTTLLVDEPFAGTSMPFSTQGTRRISVNFRLWLTARLSGESEARVDSTEALALTPSPRTRLPASLLRSCISVAVEPPRGLHGVVSAAALALKKDTVVVSGDDGSATSALLSLVFTFGIAEERKRSLGLVGWGGSGAWRHTPGVSDLVAAAAHVFSIAPYFPRDETSLHMKDHTGTAVRKRISLLQAAATAVAQRQRQRSDRADPWLSAIESAVMSPGVSAANFQGDDQDRRLFQTVLHVQLFEAWSKLDDFTIALPGGARFRPCDFQRDLKTGAFKAPADELFASAAQALARTLPSTIFGGTPATTVAADARRVEDVLTAVARLNPQAPLQSDAGRADSRLRAVACELLVWLEQISRVPATVASDLVWLDGERRRLRNEADVQARRAAGDFSRKSRSLRERPREHGQPPEKKRLFDGISPFEAVLLDERQLLRETLEKCRSDLISVVAVLDGSSAHASESERQRLGSIMADLRVFAAPAAWRFAASPLEQMCPTVDSWHAAVTKRRIMLEKWIKATSRPAVLDLSLFANPALVMLALRKGALAKHWCSLDDVAVTSTVVAFRQHSDVGADDSSIVIEGMVLEGCQWDLDRCELVDADRPDAVFSRLPNVRLDAVPHFDTTQQQGLYRCPVYATVQRGGSALFWVDLPSSEQSTARPSMPCENSTATQRRSSNTMDQPHWIVRGVASVLALPDGTLLAHDGD